MFENLKVLELASVLAGPSVGQFFAEMGAEVIKIENLKTGGDVTRSWKGSTEKEGDISAYFCCCNWGKKSVALDLNTIEGKSIVHRLALRSDIIIASYKPGDAEKLGVSYDQLSLINRQLIYGQITGYGSQSDQVGYDAVIQAESGFMDLNGEKDGPPVKMPVALIDVLAGHQLKEALLLALIKKERSGKGSFVEVSLLQTAVSSLANQATNWLVADVLPIRKGSAHPNIAPYGEVFKTSDDKLLLLAVGNDKQFKNLMKILGNPLIAELSLYSTNEARVRNRKSLRETLVPLIQQIESQKLLTQLHFEKVPGGLIQNIQQLFEMPEAKEMILVAESLKGVRVFAGSGLEGMADQLSAPPSLGQHNNEIIASL
ncbi:MAG: CoA transferase [Cyclobacteriaceae bacterium]|nr:CoA transferase [Cyclobacteriaceae bacterium]